MSEAIDFRKLNIKEYQHWKLFLNEHQCYPGRLCLVAKRENAIDFIAMTTAEREEFFQIAERANKALQDLFAPDLMNYASLGNQYRHLHVHLIPRYKTPRYFAGVEFIDRRWGENYAPYDREFQPGMEKLLLIKNAIAERL
ncbi:MAG: HIT family protein [Deltaproteobacteria bacterium]|nr:HIT family protein [Deltaproteobacteria bacterium]